MNISKIKELEPGKIYIAQLPIREVTKEMIHAAESLIELCKSHDINVIVVDENINFIDAPEGYEIKKTEITEEFCPICDKSTKFKLYNEYKSEKYYKCVDCGYRIWR